MKDLHNLDPKEIILVAFIDTWDDNDNPMYEAQEIRHFKASVEEVIHLIEVLKKANGDPNFLSKDPNFTNPTFMGKPDDKFYEMLLTRQLLQPVKMVVGITSHTKADVDGDEGQIHVSPVLEIVHEFESPIMYQVHYTVYYIDSTTKKEMKLLYLLKDEYYELLEMFNRYEKLEDLEKDNRHIQFMLHELYKREDKTVNGAAFVEIYVNTEHKIIHTESGFYFGKDK